MSTVLHGPNRYKPVDFTRSLMLCVRGGEAATATCGFPAAFVSPREFSACGSWVTLVSCPGSDSSPPGLAPIRVGHGHKETKNCRSYAQLRLAAPSTAAEAPLATTSSDAALRYLGNDGTKAQTLSPRWPRRLAARSRARERWRARRLSRTATRRRWGTWRKGPLGRPKRRTARRSWTTA